MNWGVAGAAAQVVASLGVIASVFYLGSQIRQSARSTRAAMYQSINMHIGAVLAPIFQSAEVARFAERALACLDTLSPEDRMRLTALCSAIFRHYDAAYYQFTTGMLAREQWEGFEAYLRMALARYPGLVGWWRESKAIFSRGFVTLVDGILDEQQARQGDAA